MAYKDPERQRAYQQQYQQARRLRDDKPKNKPTQNQNPVGPLPVQIETARQVLARLVEQMDVVRGDSDISTVERAKVTALLVRTALQAIEIVDVTTRLEALEALVKANQEAA